ncbi:MAG: Penicillin-binding protein 1A [Acidimicrobiales bacterium]|nr:MAG: PBP1A family penicillin-binding protein [Actinomycetota bacterium]MBV6508361.1 Penicillin-binding protein 1A [Acidimicrobiales bacterium]RIK04820.1 MAG: hypothetical protein DCC48_12315 [Acidobacteriota bacterium]
MSTETTTPARPPAGRRNSRSRRGAGASKRGRPRTKLTRAERKERRRARRSIFWRLRRVFYLLLVLAIVGVTGVWLVLSTIELPEAERPVETSFVCDAATAVGSCGPDTALAQFSAEENRVLVEYDDLPQILIDAVIAAEDRDYFEHSGVDPIGIARAAYYDIRDLEVQQGGSTITQQYVKNVFLSSDRTLVRKLKEAVLAVKLEQEFSKEEILERYLNEIYFGRGAYGVEAASRVYFGKPVDQIQLHEAALLAGLISSPEDADPQNYPDEAAARRSDVLNAMVEEGYITDQQAAEAAAIPWVESAVAPDGQEYLEFNVLPWQPSEGLGPVKHAEIGTEYVVEYVRRELAEMFGEGAVYTEGLRVYTTLDLALQADAYAATTSPFGPLDPVASTVAVDDSGRIVAMVGGTDFAGNEVNLALGAEGGGSGRQPGSTFKVFALTEFVAQGNSVEDTYYDSPGTITLDIPGFESWKVSNYGGGGQGTLSVERATWKSSNTVYAQIMEQVGAENVANLAESMGITSDLPEVPSLVLGSAEVSPLDMATAFSTLMRDGLYVEPHIIERVEDSEGNVLYDANSDGERRQVVEPEVADTVESVLEGVIENGTGTAADFGQPAVGKTGTTEDNRDAWFVGFDCKLAAAVWVGYETPVPMTNVQGVTVTGGSFPAEIWRDFMSRAAARHEPCPDIESSDYGTTNANAGLSPTTTYQAPVSTLPEGGGTTTVPPTTSSTVPPTTSSTTPSGSTSSSVAPAPP